MKKVFILVFLICIVFYLPAQDNIFSFTLKEKSVTQNTENTKALLIDRDELDDIISEGMDNFFLRLPLLDENFLNVQMERFSILSAEHNLITQTSDGISTQEYTPDFQSYYLLFEGNAIGTFLYFENSIIISYKYNNRQFEINKIDNQFILFDINDCLINNTFSCEVEEKISEINIASYFSFPVKKSRSF